LYRYAEVAAAAEAVAAAEIEAAVAEAAASAALENPGYSANPGYTNGSYGWASLFPHISPPPPSNTSLPPASVNPPSS
jgi:hypothetical protein